MQMFLAIIPVQSYEKVSSGCVKDPHGLEIEKKPSS